MRNNKSKKKILEFLPSFEDGGVEKMVYQYYNYIDKNRFEIKILTLFSTKSSKSSLLEKAKKNNIKIDNCFLIIKNWNGNIFNRIFKKFFSIIVCSIFLKKYLIDNHITTIHAHLDVLEYLSPISNFLRKKQIRLYYTCHSIPERWLGENYCQENKAAKLLLKHNNLQIFGLHKQMAKQINSLFHINNCLVLENFIDFNEFKISNSKKQLRKKYGIPEDAYVIGNVSRFIKSKNHFFLIDLFSYFLKHNPKSLLLLIGNQSNYLDIIKKTISEKHIDEKCIILTNRDDVNLLLQTMDVFIFPSLYEGFSLALIEAQISNIKTVYSDFLCEEHTIRKSTLRLPLNIGIEKWYELITGKADCDTKINRIEKYNAPAAIKKIMKFYSL